MEAAVFILLQFRTDNFFIFTTSLSSEFPIKVQSSSTTSVPEFCSTLVCELFVPDVIKNLFNIYSNFQRFEANEISLESSSFVHCKYCIFKLLSARINFFYILHLRLH